jgi:hypothetical protein
MSQLVKTKRQARFKGFKRFGAFKGLVEQKNVVFNSFVYKLSLFWHEWAILKWPTRAKKDPIYTKTRQINYYYYSYELHVAWQLRKGTQFSRKGKIRSSSISQFD